MRRWIEPQVQPETVVAAVKRVRVSTDPASVNGKADEGREDVLPAKRHFPRKNENQFTSLLWRRVSSLRAVVFRFQRGNPLKQALGFLCTRRCRRMRPILIVAVLESKSVDAASGDSDVPEPSVTSMAGLGDESPASPVALDAEYDRPVPASPASRHALACAAGSSCRQGDGCARHPNLSAFYRRLRDAKSLKAKADNEGSEGDEPEPADAGLLLQPPNSQDRIDFPAVPPQVVESRARTPHCRTTRAPASSNRRMPSHAFSPRAHAAPPPVVGLIYNREHRHPLVLDDGGEQNEDCSVVPPQAQESRAGMPSLSGDESGNESELANTEPSMQPSTSQEQVNL
ncbi:hypothetical protein GGTG_14089 [Gaeumannomyces tritici R3-111a-1]|uniref:Uncharacterized protein n=1 Tax=Gaeumannomyces tritici (strain R3-111a-1) TaxID=644352 RepID=J3PKM6_GAET3|nr:hypothetical protein GGTG_14089 [Gaeumannomyces tritici R3-111a-1]EJT68331.1 hypothetical protein GGTG_14089 [Gaeumannomyces tritici R3-111a-1]